jgi:hypothetical protein
MVLQLAGTVMTKTAKAAVIEAIGARPVRAVHCEFARFITKFANI